ncbi:SDR family NAD(P)-dependent oxidoreductase [Alsobacter sp. SYSU BS001988]
MTVPPAPPASLSDKVAVVVGGAGGIGKATAELFARAGARVVITHRPGADKAEQAARIVAELAGSGHAASPADVADTATLNALRDAVAQRYGRCDILVNSAGFTKPVAHADLDALDDDLIDRMFQVNWRGQFAAIRAFAPLLKASGDGLIVSVSSIAGVNGAGSSIAYSATKAGIDVMTKSLGRALAPEIRVLGVSPGVVDTGFVPGRGAEFNARTAASTPLRRVATAMDVAAAILACATHLTFSTGSTLVVDGGRSL